MATFDQNKYKKIFEERFGAGSYDAGLSSARQIGQLQAQAAYAKDLYSERRKSAEKAAKAAAEASESNSIFEGTITNNEAAKQLDDMIADPKREGAYRNAEKIRNDPSLQSEIKARGWTTKQFIDAMYNAASGGQYKSERDFNSFNKQLKTDTKAANKKRDQEYDDKYGMTYQEYHDYKKQQEPGKTSTKKTSSKKTTKDDDKSAFSNIFSKLKKSEVGQAVKAAEDFFNPFDKVSGKEAVNNYLNRDRSKAAEEVSRGANRFVDSASLGAMSNLDKRINNREPYYNTTRKIGEGGGLDMLTTGLGYLVPGIGTAKALRGTKLGADLSTQGLTRALQLGKEGAVTGLGMSGAEVALREGLNPDDYTAGENAKYIALNTGLGAVADPSIYGLVRLANKGIQSATNRAMSNLLPSDQQTAKTLSSVISKDDLLKPTEYALSNGSKTKIKSRVDANVKDITAQLDELRPKVNEYKQEFDKAVKQQYDYLKSSMNKGVEVGTTSNGELGNFREVTGRYTISNNPQWYRDFYDQTGRKPNDQELWQLAEQQVREGFEDELGSVQAWKPQAVQEIDDEMDRLTNLLEEDPSQEQAIRPYLEALDQDKADILKNIDEGLNEYNTLQNRLNTLNKANTQAPIEQPSLARLNNTTQSQPSGRLVSGQDFEPIEQAPKGQEDPGLIRLTDEGLANGEKIRKHITTLKESPNTIDELRERLFSTYTPTTNKEAVDFANQLVNSDIERAVSFVKSAKVFKPAHVATGHRLIQEFQKSGQIERAVDIAEHIAKQGTKAGQTVQAYSIYNRLSPEGILVHANRVADRVNSKLGPNAKKSVVTPEMADQLTDLSQTAQRLTDQSKAANSVIDLMDKAKAGATLTDDEINALRQFGKDIKKFTGSLSPKKDLTGKMSEADKAINKAVKNGKLEESEAENLRKFASEIREMSGDAKDEANQELQATLQSLEKPTLLEKISAAQTIAQLLNPKTQVRNALGNELFYRLERINKRVATPIDWAASKVTGKERTVTFKTNNQGQYWKNWIKGAKAGWKGVNPEGLTTQYDLKPNVFSNKWNPLTYMQKALGASLKSFDYAGYKRAVNNTIGEMATLRAVNEGLKGEAKKIAIEKYIREADENILMIADQYGKYVTFQDNNIFSVGLQKLKRGLNVGKEFGMGDLIIKYPRTPGSLLARALEYSPAGFLKTAYQLATPILKQGEKVARKDILEGLTRSLIGTAGVSSIAWFLADKGIITGTGSKDYDTADLENQAGKAKYSVNVTALKRWALNGFNPKDAETQKGDTFWSYNWAQPIATGISIGANMNYNQKTTGKTNVGQLAIGAIDSILDTMVEQSVLQGVKKAATSYPGQTTGDKITDILGGLPASFVPTAFNQLRQYTDNTARSTFDPSKLQKYLNQAQNRIPGAASSLPPSYDTLGNQKEVYQNDSNTLFNVFLNPAFVKQYDPTPEAEMVLNIINETGDTSVAPRSAQKYLMIDGERYDLTPEQYSDYQRRLGEEVRSRLEKLVPYAAEADQELLGKKVNKILDDAGRKVRKELKAEYQ